MPSTSKKQHNFMAAVAHNPAFAKKAGVPQSVGKDFNEADKGRKFSKGGDMKTDSQFDADVDRAKRSLYKNKEDSKIYSRERGLSPGMAAKRLENRGVDMRGLVANEQNPDDLGSYKKGGNVKKMNMGGYADGGMPMVMKDGKKVPSFAADGVGKMKHGGMAGMHKMPDGKMMKDSAMKKMANGGMAKADMKQDKGMMQKAVNKHEGRLHKGATMTKLASGGMAPSKMGAVKTSKKIDGIATKGKTKGTMIAMKRGGKC